MVLEGEKPPYVHWSISLTLEAREKLERHFGIREDEVLQNHTVSCKDPVEYFTYEGNERYRDHFGVLWNRSVDKDIGVVEQYQLLRPSLAGYHFPDPGDERFCAAFQQRKSEDEQLFTVYQIGFSLFERAWTLRGMQQLYMDMIDEPAFVHRLLGAVADFHVEVIRKACRYDIDAVYFGDDWGAQRGLLMGPGHWKEYIYPYIWKMYQAVRDEGKYVWIHSCGKVDELFEILADAGVSCFNPFQPEVMDVYALMDRYRGKLAFHGGISTQRTLPYGTPREVREEITSLLEAGKRGGYIISPAHAVEGDVPLENLTVMLETIFAQEQ